MDNGENVSFEQNADELIIHTVPFHYGRNLVVRVANSVLERTPPKKSFPQSARLTLRKAFFKRALEAIDLPGEIIKSGSTKKASTFCYMIIVIACTTTRLSITIIVSHILQLRL